MLAREGPWDHLSQEQLLDQIDRTEQQRRLEQSELATSNAAIAARGRIELLRWNQVEALEAPQWLVHGVIRQNALVVLYGPSGVGKSFTALDLALSVASGMPWHGRGVQQAGAVFIAGEGVLGLKWRVRAWLRAPDEPRTEQGADNARLVHDALDVIEQLEKRFFVHAGAVQLFDGSGASDVDALIDAIQELGQPIGMVVVDTLARCSVGADENQAKDVARFVGACDRIRHETSAAVLVVHHCGKNGTLERGSTALRGAADAMLSLKVSDNGLLTLAGDKARDDVDLDPIAFRLHQVELGEEGGEPASSVRLRVVRGDAAGGFGVLTSPYHPDLGDDELVILRCLRDDLVDGEGLTRRKIGEWTKQLDERQVSRRVKGLIENGFIEEAGKIGHATLLRVTAKFEEPSGFGSRQS